MADFVPRDDAAETLRAEMKRAGSTASVVNGRWSDADIRKDAAELVDRLVTEDNTAQLFMERHGRDVLFDHTRGRWLVWRSGPWPVDRTGMVKSYARLVARAAAAGSRTPIGAPPARPPSSPASSGWRATTSASP